MAFARVIHSYTDADAIADGTLIDLSELGLHFADLPINRITQNLWYDYFDFSPQDARRQLDTNPDACADLRTFVEAVKKSVGILQPLTEPAVCGTIVVLPFNRWLVGNEVGGFTLMWPSDY